MPTIVATLKATPEARKRLAAAFRDAETRRIWRRSGPWHDDRFRRALAAVMVGPVMELRPGAHLFIRMEE